MAPDTLTKVHVFDPGKLVLGRSAAGPLPSPDGGRGFFGRGRFVVLAVALFILRVGGVEPDGALVQPANVARVQAVTAGPAARGPRVPSRRIALAVLQRAAEHQPVGGAGWGLADRLLPS